jgi:hypothetical protein
VSISREDLTTIIAASQAARAKLKTLSPEEIKEAELGGVARQLVSVTKKAKAVDKAVTANDNKGKFRLDFTPEEWWALFYAMQMYRFFVADASQFLPGEKTSKMMRSIVRVSNVVHKILHDPSTPGRCTCQDRLGPGGVIDPSQNYVWN